MAVRGTPEDSEADGITSLSMSTSPVSMTTRSN